MTRGQKSGKHMGTCTFGWSSLETINTKLEITLATAQVFHCATGHCLVFWRCRLGDDSSRLIRDGNASNGRWGQRKTTLVRQRLLSPPTLFPSSLYHHHFCSTLSFTTLAGAAQWLGHNILRSQSCVLENITPCMCKYQPHRRRKITFNSDCESVKYLSN